MGFPSSEFGEKTQNIVFFFEKTSFFSPSVVFFWYHLGTPYYLECVFKRFQLSGFQIVDDDTS